MLSLFYGSTFLFLKVEYQLVLFLLSQSQHVFIPYSQRVYESLL